MSFEMDVTEIKDLIDSIHGEFVCPECGVTFGSRTGFSEHMTKKHSGKTYDTSNHKSDCNCFVCKAKRGEYAGENNPSFGTHPSEETIQKMRLARLGKTYDEIYGEGAGDNMRKRRSAESTGRYQSPEKGQKISAALKNKPKSEAHKKKLSDVWDIGHDAEAINKMARVARSKYMTGYFKSVMNNVDIYYGSSYELYTYICLEHDDDVESFGRCSFKIPYVFKGDSRRHVPDIEIHYKDGSITILEIKPAKFVNDPEVTAKRLAGEIYCEDHGMSYEMHTEEEIQRALDKRNKK